MLGKSTWIFPERFFQYFIFLAHTWHIIIIPINLKFWQSTASSFIPCQKLWNICAANSSRNVTEKLCSNHCHYLPSFQRFNPLILVWLDESKLEERALWDLKFNGIFGSSQKGCHLSLSSKRIQKRLFIPFIKIKHGNFTWIV